MNKVKNKKTEQYWQNENKMQYVIQTFVPIYAKTEE